MMKTDEQKRVLRKLMILCWAALIAILGCMWPMGYGLDTPESKYLGTNISTEGLRKIIF